MVIPDVDKEMNEKSRVLIGTLALLMLGVELSARSGHRLGR